MSGLLLYLVLNLAQQVAHRAEIRQSLDRRLLRRLLSRAPNIHIHITASTTFQSSFLPLLPHLLFFLLSCISDGLLSFKVLFLHQALIHKLGLFGEAFALPSRNVP